MPRWSAPEIQWTPARASPEAFPNPAAAHAVSFVLLHPSQHDLDRITVRHPWLTRASEQGCQLCECEM
jgi:hypothetical protein